MRKRTAPLGIYSDVPARLRTRAPAQVSSLAGNCRPKPPSERTSIPERASRTSRIANTTLAVQAHDRQVIANEIATVTPLRHDGTSGLFDLSGNEAPTDRFSLARMSLDISLSVLFA